MRELNNHTLHSWLRDDLEGRLSDTDRGLLYAYLEQHPEADPETADDIRLSAPVMAYPDKADLYQAGFTLPDMTEADYLCIAAMEDDAFPEQTEQFEARRRQDPEFERLYATFLHTRLQPDPAIRIPNPESLRRKVIRIPAYVYGALSTAALLLLAFFIFKPDSGTQTENQHLANEHAREIIYLNKLRHPASYDLIALSGIREKKPVNRQPARISDSASLFFSDDRSLEPMRTLSARTSPSVMVAALPPAPHILNRARIQPEPLAYQTLWAYTGELIRKSVLGQDPELVKSTRFSLWEVADAGLEKAADWLSVQADISREYNEAGELKEVHFSSPLVAFSAPVSSAPLR